MLYRQAAGRLRAVRPGWRRALAGTYLAAAIAGAGPLVMPAAAVQPVIGVLNVSPSPVDAGLSQPFTLTFTDASRVADITLTVQVPAGWPAPQMQPGDTDGFTSCADCTTDPGVSTITIPVSRLVPPGGSNVIPSSVSVMYSAVVPASASDTFTATAQQNGTAVAYAVAPATLSVTPVATQSSTSPATQSSTSPGTQSSTSPATQAPTSPATQSAASSPTQTSTSPATQTASSPSVQTATAVRATSSGRAAGAGSAVSIPVAVGLAAALVAVFAVGWFGHRRPAPLIAQSVQAVPHAGAPARLSVRTVGPDETHTVRIEPHLGAAATPTTRELPP